MNTLTNAYRKATKTEHQKLFPPESIGKKNLFKTTIDIHQELVHVLGISEPIEIFRSPTQTNLL